MPINNMNPQNKVILAEMMKEYSKSQWESPMTEEQISIIDDLLFGPKTPVGGRDYANGLEQGDPQFRKENQGFLLAIKGDYSKFETISPFFKNYLGTKTLNQFLQDHKGAPDPAENEEVRHFLEENAMNLAFRSGLSIARRQGTMRAQELQKYEHYINQHIMKKTLGPISASTDFTLNELKKEDKELLLSRNRGQRVVAAKMLLLGQLGRFDVTGKDGKAEQYTEPMAEAFAHGGRTKFALSFGGDQKKLMEAVLGKDPQKTSGLAGRTAATHHTTSKKFKLVDGKYEVASEMKESRVGKLNLPRLMSNQYGMNMSIGGYGNKGPDGKLILDQGSNGHMYIRAEKGDKLTCGSLLVGIENSGPGAKSCIGSVHGASGKSAATASFMGDKNAPGVGEIDSRSVDLSGIQTEVLTDILNKFDTYYSKLQKEAEDYTNPAAREAAEGKLNNLNSMLCGEQVEPERMAALLRGIGVQDTRALDINAIVHKCRNPQTLKERALSVQPDEKSVESTYASMQKELSEKVELDISDAKQANRLQVMVESKKGKKLQPLFDPERPIDKQERLDRLSEVMKNGNPLYAYKPDETVPYGLNLNTDSPMVTLEESPIDKGPMPIKPKKPGVFYRICNTLSGGYLFQDKIEAHAKAEKEYQAKKEVYDALAHKEKVRRNRVQHLQEKQQVEIRKRTLQQRTDYAPEQKTSFRKTEIHDIWEIADDKMPRLPDSEAAKKLSDKMLNAFGALGKNGENSPKFQQGVRDIMSCVASYYLIAQERKFFSEKADRQMEEACSRDPESFINQVWESKEMKAQVPDLYFTRKQLLDFVVNDCGKDVARKMFKQAQAERMADLTQKQEAEKAIEQQGPSVEKNKQPPVLSTSDVLTK